EPIEHSREQSGRVCGLPYGIGKNRPHFGLHRQAVTCRARLQTPLDGLVKTSDAEGCHLNHLLPAMLALSASNASDATTRDPPDGRQRVGCQPAERMPP